MIDYEKDIEINESELDLEWLEQPQLVSKYARAVADLEAEYSRAKERLDVVKAELDRDIRSNPDKYGLDKITESVVTNTILLQPEYQEGKEALIEAKHELDLAKAAIHALQDKRRALENLVQLHGMQYFSGPTVPRNLSEEWQARKERAEKKANTAVGKGMRRSRK